MIFAISKNEKVKEAKIDILNTNDTLNIGDALDNQNNEKIKNEEIKLTKEVKKEFTDSIVGYLTIEKIGIKEQVVKEGVSLDVINYNIGHFTNTSIFNGNIGLAAHNGGVENASFFKDIHTLEPLDKIIYETKYGKRTYEVKSKITIDSYDWSYLGKEDKNVLTLITCITGKRNERLCVRAEEIKNNI